MNFTATLRTATEAPWALPQRLRKRATEPLRRVLTWHATKNLPDQQDVLDDARDDDYLLVVLDACRWDMYQRLAVGLFDQRAEPMRSAGHDTFEYLSTCWSGHYPDVTYVSGATPVAGTENRQFEDEGLQALYGGYLPSEHIGEIVDAWDTHWDPSLGTVPPEAVVGEAIDRLGERRLVCHLFQPHAPYIGEPDLLGHTDDRSSMPEDGEPVDAPLWQRIKRGEISQDTLTRAYEGNLRRALDSVCLLLEATDRDAVVIGDHGEALGGLGVFSHPRTPHPHVRTVPWARVSGLTPQGRSRAADARQRLKDYEPDDAGGCVKDRLESLGYL